MSLSFPRTPWHLPDSHLYPSIPFFVCLFVFWCGPFFQVSIEHCYNITSVLFWIWGPKAWGILASWPRIEPAPPAMEGEVLTTGPPGKSLPPLLKSPFPFVGWEGERKHGEKKESGGWESQLVQLRRVSWIWRGSRVCVCVCVWVCVCVTVWACVECECMRGYVFVCVWLCVCAHVLNCLVVSHSLQSHGL